MADIYNEVIAEKKKLLEVAEERAKKKIIEAVTPRVKELMERALLGEMLDEPSDDEDLLLGDEDPLMDPAVPGLSGDIGLPDVMAPPVETTPEVTHGIENVGDDNAAFTLPDHEGKIVLDMDAISVRDGDDAYDLTPESLRALGSLLEGRVEVDVDRVIERVRRMQEQLDRLDALKQEQLTSADGERMRQLRTECKRLFSSLQRAPVATRQLANLKEDLERTFGRLERYSASSHLGSVIKEMNGLNARAGRLNARIRSQKLAEADVRSAIAMMQEAIRLHTTVDGLCRTLDADDSIDEAAVRQVGSNIAMLYTEMRNMVTKKGKLNEADDEMGLDMPVDDAAGLGDEGLEGDVDVEQMLVTFKMPTSLSDMQAGSAAEVVSVEPAGPEEGMDDAALGDDMGLDDDAGLDDMELDADVADGDLDDDVEEETVAYANENNMRNVKLNNDDIIEIDEAALIAEMEKMGLREDKYQIQHGGHGPGSDLSDFGGGDDEGDLFVDGEDLNAHDPSGSEGYLDESVLDENEDEEYYEVKEDWHRNAGRRKGTNESVLLKKKNKQLAETVKRARAELAEQKLFSTKLVALSKVLQVPGLTQGQKQRVVETLEKGRTVADVERLYSRIMEALKKKAPVKESVERSKQTGSSRPMTSSSPSRDAETDPLFEKWNRIAFSDGRIIQG